MPAVGPVTEYVIDTQYDWDMGTLALPLGQSPTALGDTQVLAQLYAPRCSKVVNWVATCMGAQPVAPSPKTGSTNERLLRKRIGVPLPGDTVDGSQVWTLRGSYIYALAVPPSDNDSLTAGVNP